MPAIRARSVRRSFPSAGNVVEDVSFDVAAGETVALVGRNQAGKSTLLRLLAGLLRPDSGEALLGGLPATRPSARRGLGFLDEGAPLPGGLRPLEAVQLAARLGGGDAKAAAERVGVPVASRRPLSRCSRGIRQRAGLAAALAPASRALILDEPFSGLDPVAWDLAARAIRDAADAGAAVLLSLHSESAVTSLADRVAVLRRGRLVREGPARDFVGPPGWLLAAVRE